MLQNRIRKYLIRSVRLLTWLLAAFLFIFFLIFISLQFPSVQTFLTGKITSWLGSRTDSEISIDRVAIRFPKSVGLKGVFVEDAAGDTLLYTGSLFANIRISALLRNRIHISSLDITDLRAVIKREKPDTVFNYQFILDAFAPDTDNEDQAAETEGSMEFHLDLFKLENISFTFEDHHSGLRLKTHLDYFQTSLRHSDLLNGKYHAGKTELRGSYTEINTGEPSMPPEPSEPGIPELDLSVNLLSVSDLAFVYKDFAGTNLNIDAGMLNLVPETINLPDYFIELASIGTENLAISILLPSGEKNEASTQSNETVAANSEEKTGFVFSEILEWTVKLGRIDIKNSFFSLREEAKGIQTDIFDPGNFSLGGINFLAKDIFAGPDRIDMDIDNMSMLISESFSLDKLSLDINLGSESGKVTLDMLTGESRLGLSLEAEANLLNFMPEDLYDKSFDLYLTDNHINKDIAFFLPFMRYYYFNWPDNQGIEFGGRVHGSLEYVTVDSLRLSGPGFFTALFNGAVEGMPKTDSLYLDIENFSLHALPGPFFASLPDTLHPEGITLPEFIDAGGHFRGTLSEFESAMAIASNLGDVSIIASMYDQQESESSFEGKIYTGSFDIGTLLQMEIITSAPSIELDFWGRGLDPASMKLKTELVVGHLSVMEHSYEDIRLDLGLNDSVATASASYSDDYLVIDLDAAIGIFTARAFGKGTMDLVFADLRRLGFSDEELMVGSSIEADITFYPEDFFNGNITFSNTNIATGEATYSIPEMTVKSESRSGAYSLDISSEFLTAGYNGNFTPVDIPGALAGHFGDYFTVHDLSPATDDDPEPDVDNVLNGNQEEIADNDFNGSREKIEDNGLNEGQEEITDQFKNFSFEITLLPDDLINMVLFPGIDKYDTLSASVQYNSREQKLTFNASMEEFIYSGTDFRNIELTIDSDPKKMDFRVLLDTVGFNHTSIYSFELSGGLFDEILDLSLSFNDEGQKELFFIRSVIESREELYHISVDSDKLILNGEKWNIDSGNRIELGEGYLKVTDLILEDRGSILSVHSTESEEHENVLEINFSEFDLHRLTGFMDNESPYIGGIINGVITIRDIYSETSFIADMNIADITWAGERVELITLHAGDIQPGHYFLSAFLKHKESELSAEGEYISGEAGFDIDLEIERLDINLLEGFLREHLSEMSGFVHGKIRFTGTPENPEFNGDLNFHETSFRVLQLNAGYEIENQKIEFSDQSISLQDFTITDSRGRQAVVDGTLDFPGLENFIFNLNLVSKNFLLMDLQAGQQDMYHGRILMDSDLQLRGDLTGPSIEGNLKLMDGSRFTFIVPQTDPQIIAQEGIVKFIQVEEPDFFQLAQLEPSPDELTSELQGIDLRLNVELDRQTGLKVIIDEIAGDNLEIKGGGDLVLEIDPAGRIGLTGAFEIQEGNYFLTFYDVIRRDFRIEPGSTIMWTGDPIEAELDITAIYSLNTSPRELMRTHVEGDQIQAGRLRQQFPFLVYLNLDGDLLTPRISFRLDMPPGHEMALDGSLMARINEINQNESELNKQVISLLLLGSFLQENPLDRPGAGGIEATARSSGSRLLTQQLNRMADRYVKGVNISFEIDSYEQYIGDETVGRTELQMEVSRNFFDDRIRFTVAGNIELEDEAHRETRAGDIAGDFTMEYLITPEGNLILKGFRNTNFNDLFESEVIETGISLIISRNFNRFRDIIRRRED